MKTVSALALAATVLLFSGAAEARVAHHAAMHRAAHHHAHFVATAPRFEATPAVANDSWKSHWGF